MAGESASPPFAALLISDDPADPAPRRPRRGWPATAEAASARLEPARRRPHPPRLFSADLTGPHVMMQLMAGMLAQFDRRASTWRPSRSSTAATDDERSIAALFDEFVPVDKMSDAGEVRGPVARGHRYRRRHPGLRPRHAAPHLPQPRRARARSTISPTAAPRARPPSTTSSPTETLVPAGSPRRTTASASPTCPAPTSRRATIEIGPAPGDRASYGLPQDGFVFCCFNNAFKISPDVFQSWMRILQRVPGSIGCSTTRRTPSPTCAATPKRRGSIRTASSSPAARLADHLARQRLADLFLDTSPYNAHTTTSDALLAGLPVLTRIGTTFAARVAASILNANGLPELVTTTTAAYEDEAVHRHRPRRAGGTQGKGEPQRAHPFILRRGDVHPQPRSPVRGNAPPPRRAAGGRHPSRWRRGPLVRFPRNCRHTLPMRLAKQASMNPSRVAVEHRRRCSTSRRWLRRRSLTIWYGCSTWLRIWWPQPISVLDAASAWRRFLALLQLALVEPRLQHLPWPSRGSCAGCAPAGRPRRCPTAHA